MDDDTCKLEVADKGSYLQPSAGTLLCFPRLHSNTRKKSFPRQAFKFTTDSIIRSPGYILGLLTILASAILSFSILVLDHNSGPFGFFTPFFQDTQCKFQFMMLILTYPLLLFCLCVLLLWQRVLVAYLITFFPVLFSTEYAQLEGNNCPPPSQTNDGH